MLKKEDIIMVFIISDEEKKALLASARETIAAKLERREPFYTEIDALKQNRNSVLNEKCGAFVTLHESDGENSLRGCIGMISASAPLSQTVCVMAREAAFGDSRFPPLSAGELPRCRIEISVLSPMERCADPGTVEVGVHGLYLCLEGRKGVLLPQVPVEQGWDRQEYLDYICVKAGLPPKSYAAHGAELYTFTAAVFGE
jgi:AmmeMemoRadiSam system protein A